MKTSLIITFFFFNFFANSDEMIFGSEKLSNGINIIFEAAPKDVVYPEEYFLNESGTDIHIEMLINWSNDAPEGSPKGGFIPYLEVTAVISNQKGDSLETQLTPHINLTDNFHYAQNIKLPGKIDELYDVIIKISPPEKEELGIHYDWKDKYGILLKQQKFQYKKLSFKSIAEKSRR